MATKREKIGQMNLYKETNTTSLGEICGGLFIGFIVLCLIAG